MTAVWITIAALALGTAVIKAAGPLFLGGRELPPRMTSFIGLLPAALLAALVVVETFGGEHGGFELDARAAGLGAAGAAVLLRQSIVVVAVVAAVAAAAVRALT
jgi:branched-subunit amino acid transport protein